MHSVIMSKNSHSKKGKKLIKLIKDSDSESDESIHELSYYLNDRVKLIKEVLKIIKPKKIRSMAPNCMRNLDNEEINSMLLEELLGISNKRLKYIFEGKTLEEDSSSTDPEAEEPIDVISLDDISDDEFVIVDSDNESSKKNLKKQSKIKVKEEPKRKKIKKEKRDKSSDRAKISKPVEEDKDPADVKNLMSVLELLELQARARAIRSQLALEKQVQEKNKEIVPIVESDGDEAVIIESPMNIEILITSSDESENENSRNSINRKSCNHERNGQENEVGKGNTVLTTSTNITEKENRMDSENTLFNNNAADLRKDTNEVLNHQETSGEKQQIEEPTFQPENVKTDSSQIPEDSDKFKTGQSEKLNGSEKRVHENSHDNIAGDDTEVNSEAPATSHDAHSHKLKRHCSRKNSEERRCRRKCRNYRKHEIDKSNVINSKTNAVSDDQIEKNTSEEKIVVVSDINISNLLANDTQIQDEGTIKNDELIPEKSKDLPQHKTANLDDGDGIVINVDQSEMAYIISD